MRTIIHGTLRELSFSSQGFAVSYSRFCLLKCSERGFTNDCFLYDGSTNCDGTIFFSFSFFFFLAPVLPGWNLTIGNETLSSFFVRWTNLSVLLGSQVQHFIVLLKSSKNNVSNVVHKIVHGTQEKTEMTGLLSSTQYTVDVFGIDKMGQPFRTLEVQARTLTGKSVSYITKCFTSFLLDCISLS